MNFLSILENIFIGPLKILFEYIFEIAYAFTYNPGLSIVFLSLLINILVLPLYKRADAMQEEARVIENKLHNGVSHIKKSFSGDEKMMILQTYYRQNNYKPTDALKGSVSLLLEIPFFMAAYQFLSHLKILSGTSFGPIKDLGSPDGLLIIGGIAINVLPILMTLVNIISSAIYLKGFPLKTKIQLYGMALFFLVFLYSSPSGLVFYWTMNNVFSLVKTIFYKVKNPKRVICVIMAVLGVAIIGFSSFLFSGTLAKKVALILFGILMVVPLGVMLLKVKISWVAKSSGFKHNKKLFVLGSVLLSLLVGALIPTSIISASPQEFLNLYDLTNPMLYVVSTLSLSIGTFLVWLQVFYWLATPKGKAMFDILIWILCGIMIINYMFFGTNLGTISAELQYETGVYFTLQEQIINLLVIFAVIVVFFVVIKKINKIVVPVLLTAIIAVLAMSVVNTVTITKSVAEVSDVDMSKMPTYTLSKEGKNVVVIMLDRAMGEYFPYIINESKDLLEQYDGFTYYSNTVSFGGHTIFGSPSLMGGYEYTPVEMNKRSDEPLEEKHNEALKVMPVLFDNEGYDVTVCDPPYAGYREIPDLTIYDEYENIQTFITEGKFLDETQKSTSAQSNHRNFFCLSIMKCMPVCVQPVLYDRGIYFEPASSESNAYSIQTAESMSVASGYKKSFMEAYNVLLNLENMTNVSDTTDNTFLFLANNTAHENVILQEPDYVPAYHVDNLLYDSENAERFTVDGETLSVTNSTQMGSYHANVAAIKKIGNWLDYLRENDIYDNTRIVIVSDHGFPTYQNEKLINGEPADTYKDAEFFYPLLLVKDFDGTGFSTSDEFMTNADVPTLVTKDLIQNPINPFTGKEINNDEKTEHEQFIILSDKWNISENKGNTYPKARWASVSQDLWDKDNWGFYEEEIVLKEHQFPEN
ncbi:MAG: YidC/Oxa1 family membrane protein insertase [Ruminococcus sp.]|nr:YidC/Oxa1 family membrane protein insertase [Ruminococcus sp.]